MSFTKRLEEARKAYQKRDKKAAKKAHDPDRIRSEHTATREEAIHSADSSDYLGSFVYGGLDGIITTFAVVSGVTGAQLSPGIILILGFANLLGDGFSMATGAFLSSRSDQEYYEREREREAWEFEQFPEGEKLEMVEIYQGQGYSEEEARKMVEIQASDPERFVEIMMVEELHMLPQKQKPWIEGLVTFASFVLAGGIPLIIYLADLIFQFELTSTSGFLIAILLSAFALFALGAAKVLVTGRNLIRSGFEMLFIGGLAAGVAFLVGYLLRGLGEGI